MKGRDFVSGANYCSHSIALCEHISTMINGSGATVNAVNADIEVVQEDCKYQRLFGQERIVVTQND